MIQLVLAPQKPFRYFHFIFELQKHMLSTNLRETNVFCTETYWHLKFLHIVNLHIQWGYRLFTTGFCT